MGRLGMVMGPDRNWVVLENRLYCRSGGGTRCCGGAGEKVGAAGRWRETALEFSTVTEWGED